eukprot:1367483-Prymnesium_polylepis.1
MDRARRPTVDFFSQNLHAMRCTPTSQSAVVARTSPWSSVAIVLLRCGAHCDGHRGRESPNGETL